VGDARSTWGSQIDALADEFRWSPETPGYRLDPNPAPPVSV
jgi:hypothetical protein